MAATVQDILNSVQDSTAASQRCAGSLWKLALSDPDETYEDLRQCIDYLVSLGQVKLAPSAVRDGQAWCKFRCSVGSGQSWSLREHTHTAQNFPNIYNIRSAPTH